MARKQASNNRLALRYSSGNARRSPNAFLLIVTATLLLTGCARFEAFISQMNDDHHSTNTDEASSPLEDNDDRDGQREERDDSDPKNGDNSVKSADPVPDGVTVGDFASGFPVELFDLPSTCEILMTSVQPDGEDSITFSANFQCGDSAKSLATHFTSELDSESFLAKESQKPEGMSKYLVFTRESESVTIGILDDDDSRVVSLGGHLMQSVTPED